MFFSVSVFFSTSHHSKVVNILFSFKCPCEMCLVSLYYPIKMLWCLGPRQWCFGAPWRLTGRSIYTTGNYTTSLGKLSNAYTVGRMKVDDSVLVEVVTVVTARHEDLRTHGLVIALWWDCWDSQLGPQWVWTLASCPWKAGKAGYQSGPVIGGSGLVVSVWVSVATEMEWWSRLVHKHLKAALEKFWDI